MSKNIKKLEAELDATLDLLAVARLQAKSYKAESERLRAEIIRLRDYIKKELSK